MIEAFTEGLTGAEATNTGNVIKYICRWKSKNGLEDLKKCRWYLNRLIDFVEKRRERELANIMNSMNTATAYHNNSDNVTLT